MPTTTRTTTTTTRITISTRLGITTTSTTWHQTKAVIPREVVNPRSQYQDMPLYIDVKVSCTLRYRKDAIIHPLVVFFTLIEFTNRFCQEFSVCLINYCFVFRTLQSCELRCKMIRQLSNRFECVSVGAERCTCFYLQACKEEFFHATFVCSEKPLS